MFDFNRGDFKIRQDSFKAVRGFPGFRRNEDKHTGCRVIPEGDKNGRSLFKEVQVGDVVFFRQAAVFDKGLRDAGEGNTGGTRLRVHEIADR